MSEFKAFRINEMDGGVKAGIETMSINDLTEGEVVIKVGWSGINYKDALAATGKGKILRKFPLNGGVDLAGVVSESTDSRFSEGDEVLVVGGGLSETLDGGYAEFARVPADIVVPMPAGLNAKEAMSLGTAGFTAAMAVMRMEDNHQSPDMGAIVVTGASGGVGSFATDILSNKGFEVTAFTGKKESQDYLSALGASNFLDRHSLELGTRPLERAEWGGAVDNVGGETLGWLTRTVKPFGNIASIGLAGGFKLETTVMPFILRGVSLLGINSIEMPNSMRDAIWQRLATDLKPPHLENIVTRTVEFTEMDNVFGEFMKAEVTGRTLVRIASDA